MKCPLCLAADRNMVCSNKSIYGFKQAGRKWNQKLSNTLLSISFLQSKSDYSLFTHKTDNNFTAVLVYVDDLILAGINLEHINNIKHVLHNKFSIKDLEFVR